MYRKTTLENGIQVVTERMAHMRSVAMSVLIKAGPQNELPEQLGLAHLTEHLMFQGTSSRNAMQIARMIDTVGGHIGAFTSRDYTCYYALVLDDYRTYALDLLGDTLLNSIFPEDSLEREKEAILREIDTAYDSPETHTHSLLKHTVWPQHPLGRPVAGHPETVKTLTREDVIYFVHEHYLPNHFIIAAAGNIDHDDFVAQIRDCFWRMLAEDKPVTSQNPRYKIGITIEHRDISQAYFSIGVPAYAYAHPDRYSLHVLNNILGGGISSRLFRRIREERGLVYNIGSEYHAYSDGGLWVIEGSTAPEDLMSVLALTLIQMWQLVTNDEPVDEEELWKTKMQIRGQHLIASEDTYTRMSRLATQELYFGRHLTPDEILTQIDAVDGQTLQRAYENLLLNSLRQAAIAIVGPQTPNHYNYAVVEELLAGFQ